MDSTITLATEKQTELSRLIPRKLVQPT